MDQNRIRLHGYRRNIDRHLSATNTFVEKSRDKKKKQSNTKQNLSGFDYPDEVERRGITGEEAEQSAQILKEKEDILDSENPIDKQEYCHPQSGKTESRHET